MSDSKEWEEISTSATSLADGYYSTPSTMTSTEEETFNKVKEVSDAGLRTLIDMSITKTVGSLPPKENEPSSSGKSTNLEDHDNIEESVDSGHGKLGLSEDFRRIFANPPECHPIAGNHFVIRTHQEPYLYVVQICGELRILKEPGPFGGHIWLCEVQDGCWGFRNMISGDYLGDDGAGKIVAKKKQHTVREYFSDKRNPGGGYVLFTQHTNRRIPVGFSEDRKSLIEVGGSGVEEAFDFIKMDYLETTIRISFPGMPKQIVWSDH